MGGKEKEKGYRRDAEGAETRWAVVVYGLVMVCVLDIVVMPT